MKAWAMVRGSAGIAEQVFQDQEALMGAGPQRQLHEVSMVQELRHFVEVGLHRHLCTRVGLQEAAALEET